MSRQRLACLALSLVVMVSTIAGCASTPATPVGGTPSAAEIAAAEAEFSSNTSTGTRMVSNSLDELVAGAPIIVVATVTKAGAMFNGRRDGNDASAPPDPTIYAAVQLYEVHVEQRLKGSVPERINVQRYIGDLPGGLQPTAARIHVAKVRSDDPSLQIGARYVFFLNASEPVPELGNLVEYPPAVRLPTRFLLGADGSATVESVKDPAVDRAFPKGPGKALIDRIQKAIAAKK